MLGFHSLAYRSLIHSCSSSKNHNDIISKDVFLGPQLGSMVIEKAKAIRDLDLTRLESYGDTVKM
jgi:hypothetical protein